MANKKTVEIRKTARHTAGAKYIEMAKKGPIATTVDVRADGRGKLEAFIDGEAIGFLKIAEEDLPEVYEIKVVGASDDRTFIAEMEVQASGTAGSGSFGDEIEKIVSEKIMSEDDANARLKVMTDNAVFPSVIRAALLRYRKFDAPLHVPSATYMNTRPKGEESVLNQLLIASLTNSAVILCGVKSTGKNVAGENLAYVRGLPYYRIGLSKDMLLDDVFGGTVTDNSAADMLEIELAKAKVRTELAPETATEDDFEKAAEFELLKAKSATIRLIHSVSDIIRWAREGGVLMLDEVNMANPNLLQAVMNSAADAEKTLIVPGVGNIKLHRDCVLLAGMNPGYAGTFDLNAATKSRCGVINFDYPDSIKAQLKANFAKDTVLKEKQFNVCDALYRDFVGAVRQGRLNDDCLNIRGFVNALKAVEAFPEATKLGTQIEIFVINGCDEDDRVTLQTMLHDKTAI